MKADIFMYQQRQLYVPPANDIRDIDMYGRASLLIDTDALESSRTRQQNRLFLSTILGLYIMKRCTEKHILFLTRNSPFAASAERSCHWSIYSLSRNPLHRLLDDGESQALKISAPISLLIRSWRLN